MGSRKKTHEEYVAELAIKNPNVEVVGEYDGNKTPILHHCKIHGVDWLMTPTNALKGKGCQRCRGEKIAKKKRYSHEWYVEQLREKNPAVVAVGEYVNAKTKILHKCLIHDIEWMSTPDCVLQGGGCPECWKEKISAFHRCTHEEYVAKLNTVNSDIVVIEQYVNANTPILHRCLIDGCEWRATPGSIIYGCGCPECAAKSAGDKQRKTHEQYVKEVECLNKDIIVVGKYIDSLTPILHKCKIDGFEWLASPTNILNRKSGCPQCNRSHGELDVKKWLDNNGIVYEQQKCFVGCTDKKALPFDFYLPEYNILIEYDGKQHHEPIEYFGGKEAFEYTKRHDEIKNKYCEDNDIRLLRIPYYEDVDEQLNNFLFA